MNALEFVVQVLFLSSFVLARSQSAGPLETVKPFPHPDFVLNDVNAKNSKSGMVIGPIQSDGQGGSKGSIAFYGGSSLIQVSSLSFSANGEILAVGSLPRGVDVWDVETRKKLAPFDAGSTCALSSDGRLLATDGKEIEIWEASSGT